MTSGCDEYSNVKKLQGTNPYVPTSKKKQKTTSEHERKQSGRTKWYEIEIAYLGLFCDLVVRTWAQPERSRLTVFQKRRQEPGARGVGGG